MFKFYKEKKVDVIIVCIEVLIEEVLRFGIMNIKEDGRLYEFEEKLKYLKNNFVLMGIYIFNWDKLKKYLKEDVKDEELVYDFGKNIIFKMLKGGEKLFVYRFKGYWKDVGIVEFYWEVNMDFLNEECDLNVLSCILDFYNEEVKIYILLIVYFF